MGARPPDPRRARHRRHAHPRARLRLRRERQPHRLQRRCRISDLHLRRRRPADRRGLPGQPDLRVHLRHGRQPDRHHQAVGQREPGLRPADRITTSGYTYDANGALTADPTRTYAYDGFGRLASATVGATTTSYTLDGAGRRLAEMTGASTRSFDLDLRDGLASILADGTRRYLPGSLGRLRAVGHLVLGAGRPAGLRP